MLLAASYYFYAFWDWRYLSLLLLSTVVDFVAAWRIDHSESERTRRVALTASLATNLGLLSVFKYFGFFVDSAVVSLNAVGFDVSRPMLEIVLPVGISFFTFQTMSYSIDVYRRRLRSTRSLLDLALFVAFFPQLVAGPIERAKHLLPILQAKRTMSTDQISRGLFLILLGIVKKLTIADGLSKSVDAIYGTQMGVSGLDVVLATYAFAFQILCDFSAYTDIARGTCKLFGIDLMINFDAPYFASGPADFWRRWHISLSSWLRDYLYIPIGGNRGSTGATYRNLMITMGLGGLWHGAAWNFIFWGIYQGTVLCVFRVLRLEGNARSSSSSSGGSRLVSAVYQVIGIAIFFQVTCYGWLLFRSNSLEQIVAMTSSLFVPGGWLELSMPRPPLSALVGLLFFIPWEALTFKHGSATFYRAWHPAARGAIVGIMLILLVLGLSNDTSTFIYFQF